MRLVDLSLAPKHSSDGGAKPRSSSASEVEFQSLLEAAKNTNASPKVRSGVSISDPGSSFAAPICEAAPPTTLDSEGRSDLSAASPTSKAGAAAVAVELQVSQPAPDSGNWLGMEFDSSPVPTTAQDFWEALATPLPPAVKKMAPADLPTMPACVGLSSSASTHPSAFTWAITSEDCDLLELFDPSSAAIIRSGISDPSLNVCPDIPMAAKPLTVDFSWRPQQSRPGFEWVPYVKPAATPSLRHEECLPCPKRACNPGAGFSYLSAARGSGSL